MQDEPEYIYRKGVGWVPGHHESYVFTWLGRRVEVVAKKPEMGELGAHTYENDSINSKTDFYTNGKPNLPKWADWFSEGHMVDGKHTFVSVQTERTFKQADRLSEMVNGKPAWVTFYVRD